MGNEWTFRLYSGPLEQAIMAEIVELLHTFRGGNICFFDSTVEGFDDFADGEDLLTEDDLREILEPLKKYTDVRFTLVHLDIDLVNVNAYDIVNGKIVGFKFLGHFDGSVMSAIPDDIELDRRDEERIHDSMTSLLVDTAIAAYSPENSTRIDIATVRRRGPLFKLWSVVPANTSAPPPKMSAVGWGMPFNAIRRHRLDSTRPWSLKEPTVGIYYEIEPGTAEAEAVERVQDEVDAILNGQEPGQSVFTRIVYRTSSGDVLESSEFEPTIHKGITAVRFLNREYAEDADLHERLARKGVRVI